jgi:hypothetical protein
MIERRDTFPDIVQTPIVENMVVGVPPVFTGLTRELDKLAEQPLLGPRADFPPGEHIADFEYHPGCADGRLTSTSTSYIRNGEKGC